MSEDKTILVTGASGFVGKHVIVQLVGLGFKVRGTLRSPSKQQPIMDMITQTCGPDAAGRFKIVICDLLSDEGWAAAMDGISSVAHVATVVVAREPKDPREVIDPALHGTERVMRFAHEAGVKRVVMTSSIAAIGYGHGTPANGVMHLDENNWTNVEGLKGTWSYSEGKTRGEQLAWDMANENDIALTTICPSMILGPTLDADTSPSMELVGTILKGKAPAVPPGGISTVDVRDVAEMHVRALMHPETAGERYLASGPYITFLQLAQIVGAHYPGLKVPTRVIPLWLMDVIGKFDRSIRQIAADLRTARHFNAAKGEAMLGRKFRSADEAIHAAAESLLALENDKS